MPTDYEWGRITGTIILPAIFGVITYSIVKGLFLIKEKNKDVDNQ